MRKEQQIAEKRGLIRTYQRHISEGNARIRELEGRIGELESLLYKYQAISQQVGDFYNSMQTRAHTLGTQFQNSKFSSTFGNSIATTNNSNVAVKAITGTENRMQRMVSKIQRYQEEIEEKRRSTIVYGNYIADLEYQITILLRQE